MGVFFLMVFSVFGAGVATAFIGEASGPAALSSGPQPLPVGSGQPKSASYQSVVRCFPALDDSRMTRQVDLAILKDKINGTFVTDRMRLKSRVVVFRDLDGSRRRLRLEEKVSLTKAFSKPWFEAQWETLDAAGAGSPWDSPAAKARPTLMEVNQILARSQIESDDRVDEETKIRGVVFWYRRQKTKVVELQLSSTQPRKVLHCEESICTCRY